MPSSINRQLREKGLLPREIGIHLVYSEQEIQFHCMICCKGIFRQQARIINIFLGGEQVYDDKLMTVPLGIQCSRCGAIYNIRTLNL